MSLLMNGEPEIDKGFDRWWNADELTQTNPFTEETPAWWAWEGWRAAKREWVGLTDEEREEATGWSVAIVPTTYGIFCDSEENAKAVALGWTTLIDELAAQFDVVWRARPTVRLDEDSGLWMAGMRVAIAPKRFSEPREICIATHSYEEKEDIEAARLIESKLKEKNRDQN